MKRQLLEYMVCPVDGSMLQITSTETMSGDEVETGALTCEQGHEYPIRDGVPRMIVPERLAQEAEKVQTRSSFSAKWRRIPDFGHDDASRSFYVNWYLERYGFGDIAGLRAFLADKRYVLEAGAGAGRDALMYGQNTPGQVFAIDLSESVSSVHRHVGHMPNIHVVQADLTVLPFREGFFDYVASDQVLHHTPNTEASFKYLTRFLAPGAQIAAYVYKVKAPIREFSDDFLRAHYVNASEEECYEFSRTMTLLGKALTDLNVELDVPEDIPILGIKAGRQNLQRFIYWNVMKCYWNETLDFETNVMTNFDWYHPLHAYRHTPEEVQRWCSEAGIDVVHFDIVESGISVRAVKPQDA